MKILVKPLAAMHLALISESTLRLFVPLDHFLERNDGGYGKCMQTIDQKMTRTSVVACPCDGCDSLRRVPFHVARVVSRDLKFFWGILFFFTTAEATGKSEMDKS